MFGLNTNGIRLERRSVYITYIFSNRVRTVRAVLYSLIFANALFTHSGGRVLRVIKLSAVCFTRGTRQGVGKVCCELCGQEYF
jgi:hypothetical protein